MVSMMSNVMTPAMGIVIIEGSLATTAVMMVVCIRWRKSSGSLNLTYEFTSAPTLTDKPLGPAVAVALAFELTHPSHLACALALARGVTGSACQVGASAMFVSQIQA